MAQKCLHGYRQSECLSEDFCPFHKAAAMTYMGNNDMLFLNENSTRVLLPTGFLLQRLGDILAFPPTQQMWSARRIPTAVFYIFF
jgi:hypothetical protein